MPYSNRRARRASMWCPAHDKYFNMPAVFIPYQYRKKGFDTWAVRQGYILGRLQSYYNLMNNNFQEVLKKKYAASAPPS